MPTLPEDLTINREVLVEEAMLSKSVVEPEEPWRVKSPVGEVEPIPTFPVAKTFKYWVLEDEAITNRGLAALVVNPSTAKLAIGLEVPMPTLPAEVMWK